MQFLLKVLANCPEYRELSDAIKKREVPAAMWGVPDSLKASFCYALCKEKAQKAIVIVPEDDIQKTVTALTSHFGGGVYIFPSREYIFRNIENASHEEEADRLSALSRILSGDYNAVVASAEAVMRYTLPRAVFEAFTVKIEKDKEFPLQKAVDLLITAGYSRSEKVEGRGQFSVRGGILDFYSLSSDNPVRIEFFGDVPDLIGEFDILTQRRINDLTSAVITPVSETLFTDASRTMLTDELEKMEEAFEHKKGYEKAKKILSHDIEKLTEGMHLASIDRYTPLIHKDKTTIFDYLNNSLVFAFELSRVRENSRNFLWRMSEDIKALAEDGVPFINGSYCLDTGELDKKVQNQGAIILESLSRSEGTVKLKTLTSINARQTSAWRGSIEVLAEDIKPYIEKGYKLAIAAANLKHADWLATSLRDKNIKAVFSEKIPDDLPSGAVFIAPFGFAFGYDIPSAKFALFSDNAADTGIKRKSIKRHQPKDTSIIKSLADLKPNDYVVHSDYGIGIYEGIFNSTVNGITRDQVKIRYAGTDVLYIPCSRLDLISKYTGADVAGIRLNKIGGSEWTKAKARVRTAVQDLAKQLIILYAERLSVKGNAFTEDTEWQREFEERFEYDETDDQLKCTAEIKRDMETITPMDRILCGDVGVGKTEVALRAAFKCAADDKQTAILVPTTVLAWQHFQTVTKRMADYPIKIEMLSRFRTPKEQQKIVKKLKTGELDIVIGTHRILQKDVQFKDLGLAIVDEEQRFGVSHKERLKELTKNVDVLTLSATPIPRTLNMALTGIRDMSVIDEPPHDRHPVATYVAEFDYGLVTDAIIKEIARGGQCYYLHNRVETIYHTASKLQEFMPDARIGAAHGQMNEEDLSQVWESLVKGEIDVLVCTTIIETGVDVPNCNTLIIEDADKLGLAQLHQIRGRVGRSARRAYAYLTYKKGKVLTEDSAKRLTAIREFTEFGSGLKIAMRDLEIRGAGNILGAEQHGHLQAVGYDMYVSLLEEAVREEKGEIVKPRRCLIDLNITAYIPEKYIYGGETRVDIYKKIAAIKTEEDARDVTDELIDRFGEPPNEVMRLIKIALIKQTAILLGLTEIAQSNGSLLFYISEIDMNLISRLAEMYKGRVMLSTAQRPYLTVNIKNDDVLELLEAFIKDMNALSSTKGEIG